MKQVNRYYRRSRISEHKFRQIIKYFALDLTANRTAQLAGLTHKTVNQIYLKIRLRLAQDCQRQSPFAGIVEVDESRLSARGALRGKRGRGASGKTIVFGIYKRNGKIYTEIVPDCALDFAASHYSWACRH
jgi:transposase-like protein